MILSTETDGETKAHKTTNTVTPRSQEQEPHRSSLGPHPSAGTESRFGIKWGPVTGRGRWASLSTGARVSGKVGVQEIPWNQHSVWLRTRGTALGRVCGHQPLGRMPGAQWGPPRSFPAPSLNCPLHILTPKLSFLPKLWVACHSFLWTKASKAHPRGWEDDASAENRKTERQRTEGRPTGGRPPRGKKKKNKPLHLCCNPAQVPKCFAFLSNWAPDGHACNREFQYFSAVCTFSYARLLLWIAWLSQKLQFEPHCFLHASRIISKKHLRDINVFSNVWWAQSRGCPGRWSRKDRGDTWAWEHDQSGWFAQARSFPAATVGSFPKLTDVSVKREWQPSPLHRYQEDWSREHCEELKKGLRQGKEERVHMENHKVCQGQNLTLC